MYRCNLSFTALNDYLIFLEMNKLIIGTSKNDSDTPKYEITNDGIQYLRNLKPAIEIIKSLKRL